MTAAPQVLSVSQLTALVKDTLASVFPSVWVSGEISDLARPQSGHLYFTLKDSGAQIKAVMWRTQASRLRFGLADGQEVICRGDIDVYPPRGTYQLIVREIEPKGMGALQLALKQLRDKLAAEGLFDPARKRPLPLFPRRIALVTSPTGAAVRDFLEVVRRRWTAVQVLVVPAKVQGAGAAAEIVAGIERANRLEPAPEVIVVARGGGSAEDLWCFNEEPVVRAIFASGVPVISAIGHEIDVTLSDLVADVRALTPSEAAERVVPLEAEVRAGLDHLRRRLAAAAQARYETAHARVRGLAERRVIRRPYDRLREAALALDALEERGVRALRRLGDRAGERLATLAGKLESLSPLGVLGRGYSVTRQARTGELVRSASDVQVGDVLATRLAAGEILSRVEEVKE